MLKSNLSWVLLRSRGDPQRALSLAQEAYRLAPEEPAVVDALGWAYYRKKLYTRAVWHLREAEELAPKSAEVREHLKKALRAQAAAKSGS